MRLSLHKTIETIVVPPGMLGTDPMRARDQMLVEALEAAVRMLTEKLGPAPDRWIYGQPDYKHVTLRHPLGSAVSESMRRRLEVGPSPRGGYSNTVNSTGGNDNQASGASFRIVIDTGDWDRGVGMNTPGQSGDPDSPFYRNLFDDWANDRFHPVFYSREKIEAATAMRIDIVPGS